MSMYVTVIKKPILTEKSAAASELGRQYTFEVTPASNKNQIRDAIEQLYKVRVQQVRTLVVHGKERRRGAHVQKTTNWKKAIVTLAAGQKIDFFQA